MAEKQKPYGNKDDNMKLWDSVCKTNPNDTKPFKGKGGFKGTAIAAQTQRKRATELWGAFGTEWGIRGEMFEVIKLTDDHHDSIITYSGELYYPGGRFGIHSDLDIWMYVKSGSYWAKNNDMRKKVRTDAFTKGLSELGFNADVFMGLFDDNKYVQEMEGEFAGLITKDQVKDIEKLIKDTGADETKFMVYLKNTYKTAKVSELNTVDYVKVIATLKAKLAQGKKDA